jgi:hypothetical protein
MNFKNRSAVVATIGAFMLALSAATANAAVTEIGDNAWFVGKGDVQTALGWDAKTTDANADSVTFIHKVTTTTTYSCVDTERGQYEEVVGSKQESSSTTKSTDASARKNGSSVVTGWNVAVSGSPVTLTNNDPGCSAGFIRNGLKETTKFEELIVSATSSVTKKNGTVVVSSSASIWDRTIKGSEE